MKGPDEDLPTLLKRSDHLGVLQYIRAHKVRDPELVVKHGKLLLGETLTRRASMGFLFLAKGLDEDERLGALEQIMMAALELQDSQLAANALEKIKSVVGKESIRYRRLLGLCLECEHDLKGAVDVYNYLLVENPANMFCLKRKYCCLRVIPEKQAEARQALNDYLEKNGADVGAWYEMAKFCAEMGDASGAAFCYEEIVLACPLDATVHCTLAEWYITIGGKENLKCARKHMSQSLELNPNNNLRALYGLFNACHAYIHCVNNNNNNNKKGKHVDDNGDDAHDLQVSKELMKFASQKISKAYKGNQTFATIQTVLQDMKESTESLE